MQVTCAADSSLAGGATGTAGSSSRKTCISDILSTMFLPKCKDVLMLDAFITHLVYWCPSRLHGRSPDYASRAIPNVDPQAFLHKNIPSQGCRQGSRNWHRSWNIQRVFKILTASPLETWHACTYQSMWTARPT